MADTFKKLAQVTLNTAVTSIYSPPAATTAIIRHMRVVNTNTGQDHTVKMYHNPNGEAGLNAVDDVILPFVVIDAGGWGEFEGTIIMQAQDTLVGQVGEAPNGEV